MKLTIRAANGRYEMRTSRGIEVRAAPEGSSHIGVLAGHAAVFDSDSVEMSGWDKPWVERIAPGAFSRTLKESPDVFAFYQHDSGNVIGRTPVTLKLHEDDKGLAFEIALIDTQLNRDTLAKIRVGQLDSMSFGFTTRSVRWDEGTERDTRTLLDVDLFEVSVVTWPAYPAASVTARGVMRSSDDESIRTERENFLKAMATPSPQNTQHLLRYWERRIRL
jgi:HK97 family phage prohead protease